MENSRQWSSPMNPCRYGKAAPKRFPGGRRSMPRWTAIGISRNVTDLSEEADQTDYSTLGVTIRTALLRAGKMRPPSRDEPLLIRWGDSWIQTVDVWQVPKSGVVRGEILSVQGDP